MKALDKQAWAAAYNLEYLGFKQREVFKLVKQEPGVRIHDTLTRLEYEEDNGEFLKDKVRLCARGYPYRIFPQNSRRFPLKSQNFRKTINVH